MVNTDMPILDTEISLDRFYNVPMVIVLVRSGTRNKTKVHTKLERGHENLHKIAP